MTETNLQEQSTPIENDKSKAIDTEGLKKGPFLQPILGLLKGFAWNPMLKLPPNQKCPCQSGLKFKKCCRSKLPEAVKQEDAANYKIQMQMPDLVFINEQNREKIEAMAKEKL